VAHWECRYCDRPMFRPIVVDGDEICMCGAEWADVKIWVEDEEYDESELDDLYDEDDEEDWDDGMLNCGCCSCCGCTCSDWYEEEYEDDET
jgi:hypothetical protein